MEVKSLKKKYKDKKFAAGCSRDVIQQGTDRLGWTLEELMEKTILAMRSCEDFVNAAWKICNMDPKAARRRRRPCITDPFRRFSGGASAPPVFCCKTCQKGFKCMEYLADIFDFFVPDVQKSRKVPQNLVHHFAQKWET